MITFRIYYKILNIERYVNFHPKQKEAWILFKKKDKKQIEKYTPFVFLIVFE